MLDNMALQDSDTPPGTSKNSEMPFAHFISTVLSPAVVALPFIILMALARKNQNIFLSVLITIFFLCIGPMTYIIIGVICGKFTDLDVSLRSQRVGPFLFGIASTLIGYIVLSLTHGQRNLETLLLLVAISGFVMMFITFWWKISMHASALSAAVTALTLVYGLIVLPAYLLVILVSWSRVKLQRHTLGQVIAGAIVGVALSWILIRIRGF
jgi:membrane-associated phospholipid phosphatase